MVKEVLLCYVKVIGIKNYKNIENFLEKVNMVYFKNNLIGNLFGG